MNIKFRQIKLFVYKYIYKTLLKLFHCQSDVHVGFSPFTILIASKSTYNINKEAWTLIRFVRLITCSISPYIFLLDSSLAPSVFIYVCQTHHLLHLSFTCLSDSSPTPYFLIHFCLIHHLLHFWHLHRILHVSK